MYHNHSQSLYGGTNFQPSQQQQLYNQPPPKQLYTQSFVSPYSQEYYQNSFNQTLPMNYNPQHSLSQQQFQTQKINPAPQDNQLDNILEKQCLTGRVNLSEMYINDDGAKKVAKYLQKHKTVNFLELKANNISSDAAADIFDSLQNNFQIKVLGLQWNRIGGNDVTGLEALYHLLTNNRSITHIDLRNNRIGQTGAHIIANIIRSNNTLSSLDLRWNEIGNTAAKAILAAVQENYSLVSLELAGNSISDNILQQIAQITAMNRDGNQRNVRKIDPYQDQQATIQQNDLEMRSRLQQQQFNLSNSQFMNTQPRFQQPYAQQQQEYYQLQNSQQQEFLEKQIPYEQQQIIQHLEAQVEQERINSLQVKEGLTRKINEKKSNLKVNEVRKQELEQQINDLVNTQNTLKSDLRNIQEDLKEFEIKKRQKLEKVMEKSKQLEDQIRENDQRFQEEISIQKEKYVLEIKNQGQDWQIKVDDLKQQLFASKTSVDDARMAIHKIQDQMLMSDLNTKEQAKEIIERTKQEAKREYKQKFDYLQSRLQKMQEDKYKAERVMANYVNERLTNQKKIAQKYKDQQLEIVKRKIDIEDIALRNKDFEVQQVKLKNDIQNKNQTIDLLTQERDVVRKQFEHNEKEVKKIQSEMDMEHKKEIGRIELFLEQQRKRIKELEDSVKDSSQLNHKLRSDYTRLQELLQGNLSTTIYRSFQEKQLV